MNEFHVFTEVFNHRRGMVRVFLGSVYVKEARRLARGHFERGEKRIIRQAR